MRHKIGTAAAAALLAMAMAAPACAQGPEITVQRPAAKGDTLQVTLSIQEPSQSAHALLCSLGYDKTQLQLESAEILPGSGKQAGNTNGTAKNTRTAGMVSAEWHDLDSAFTGGEVLQLQFTALCDFTETTLEVQDVQLAAMQNGVAKKLTAKTAALTVSGGIQPGDLNRNGKIDSGDLVSLRQVLAKLNEPDFTAATAADLNGNGKIDSGDLVSLRRILAKIDDPPTVSAEASCTLD